MEPNLLVSFYTQIKQNYLPLARQRVIQSWLDVPNYPLKSEMAREWEEDV
jgi:hypothetical protein